MKSNHKYPPSVREFALKMDYASPRAYEILRDTFDGNLPGKTTIRKWYANSHMDAQPGVNKNMLQLIEKKVAEQKAKGSEFVCSLAVDEMSIRQHAQWCNEKKCIIGYPTYGQSCSAKKDLAKQAIVFMLTGVNERFQLAIAYHFVVSLNGEERGQLLETVLNEVVKTEARIICVTSDGLPANTSMYEYLGANLKLESDEFQPFMNVGGQKIYVIRDPPHMHKLVRNALASKMVLFDGDNGEIKWSYIVKLVEYGKSKGLNLTHKLNTKHLQWERHIMMVVIAVETLSASTAGCMELLMKHGEAGFQQVEPTIRFILIFDKLFDIFNTKKNNEQRNNIFKTALSSLNSAEILSSFQEAEKYIERLSYSEDDIERKLIIHSKIKTGFIGYISNMKALMLIYQEFIEGKIMSSIPVYYLNQDGLEMFFGKCRAHLGFNDNPTAQQFCGTLRKLTALDSITCSKYSNCSYIDIPSQPFANILYVSSRSSNAERAASEEISSAELATLHCKLSEMEILENSSICDTYSDYTIIYICNQIEQRIGREDRMYCSYCQNVFQDKQKVNKAYLSSKVTGVPCQSTFIICKEANLLLKLRLLSEIDVRQLRAGIYSRLDIETLYPDTDFSHDVEHKIYLIRAIIDLFIQIKGAFIAKSMTFDAHQKLVRSKLRKLIHAYGL